MSLLYVNENGAKIGISDNRFVVEYKDGMKRSIPAETLDGITIMGRVEMTTPCVERCLIDGITVTYLSKGGNYFGRLNSTGHINVSRQRKQCALYDTDFSVNLSKKIIYAKIKNQTVILNRYGKSRNIDVENEMNMMKICRNKLDTSTVISEMIGYEGQAAKYYFSGLSKCIEEEFVFRGRSRRPPMDEFNSMISLGYSILMNELYCKIEMKGLNPYFGFLHRDAEKHPTLASDLMEEWRAVIVDATVMSMINGHEVSKDEFYKNVDEPGCYLAKEALGKYLNKLERKFRTEVRYLPYVSYPVSFRRAIMLQVNELCKAIENGDADLYEPIQIR